MKVLCVGADFSTIETIQLAVRFRWPEADFLTVASPDEGFDVLGSEAFDLAFCCLDGPRRNIATCERIRQTSEIPLIVVAGAPDDHLLDEVRALNAGADDYVAADSGLVDLAARVVALMRRIDRTSVPQSRAFVGGALQVNPGTNEVYFNGHRITLTATEYSLLLLLLRNRGTVLQHRFLERSLWGNESHPSLLKKHVVRLRQKIADATGNDDEWIRNIYGVGYQFIGPDAMQDGAASATA